MKRLLVATFLLVSTLFGAQITQDNSDGNTGDFKFIGQSFTATGNDTITSIQIASTSATTVTLRFYNGQTNCETVPGNSVVTGGSINTTVGLNLPDTNPAVAPGEDMFTNAKFTTLTLGTPLSITNTQQYTFCVERANATTLEVAFDNTAPLYAGGQTYNTTGFIPLADIAFRINIATSVATTVNAPISPLAYIVLALGVLFIGVRQSRSIGVN